MVIIRLGLQLTDNLALLVPTHDAIEVLSMFKTCSHSDWQAASWFCVSKQTFPSQTRFITNRFNYWSDHKKQMNDHLCVHLDTPVEEDLACLADLWWPILLRYITLLRRYWYPVVCFNIISMQFAVFWIYYRHNNIILDSKMQSEHSQQTWVIVFS